MPLQPGARLGPYEIAESIGAGGMGEVYRARDTRLDRSVAVKVLAPHLADKAASRDRFEREAKAVAALSHPNILAIHDFGVDQGVYYAVTEFLEGENLHQRLGRAPLPWRQAVEIGLKIAEGLSAAHGKGIVHRDLKPGNIFLTSDGQVKILDFGLARVTSEAVATIEPTASLHTMPGVLLGTLGYMSPEQARGLPADAQSDLFSLGCVLYEMVSGERAFARPAAPETLAAILNEHPPGLNAGDRDLPAELERVIFHCLEKQPRQRFHSAHDLAFDLRSISSSPGTARRPGAQPALRPSLIWGGAGAVVCLLLLLALLYWRPWHGTADIASLAVLPMVNESADPDTEYLSDGITETIINSLSQLPKLRVIARTTAFRYKGKDVDPRTAGRDLRVGAVLTGKVLLRGDTLIVQAELVNVEDGSQLWGERYNRKLSDLIAMQGEIARQISHALRLKLTGEEEKLLAKRHTENTEAYQLYLQGRFYQERRTDESLRKSADCFEQAIAKDPSYALAYSGLSDSYSYLGNHGFAPPREVSPKGKAAAEKALQIDGSLAEAHTSLAYVSMNYDWDWAKAGGEFRRALELNPGYTKARSLYAWYWMAQGRFEEALSEIRRARDLDPLSLYDNTNLGWHLHMARRYDEAVQQLRMTIGMDPNAAEVHYYLGQTYVAKKMYTEAIAELRLALKLHGGTAPAKSALGHVLGLAGQHAEARRLHAELVAQSSKGYVSQFDMAMILVGLGAADQALTRLENAVEQRDGWVASRLKVDPRLDGMRGGPRFSALMARVGLTP